MLLSKISGDKVIIGEGALSQLDNILPRYKNILLFNDKDGFHPCGAAGYFNQKFLRGAGAVFSKSAPARRRQSVQYVSYAGKALPIEDVEEKYREVKHNTGVDLIIAVGGGTIIDIAKIISIAYSNQCEKVEEILSDKTLENRLDSVFIPTTAGTGSEATSFAVVYKDKVKISIDRKSLLPTYIVLDPLLLKSLPIPILNSTVLDALAQAVESIWARGSTGESKEYSKEAIRLILDNLDKENTIERLSQVQVASHLAGKAINISKTTLPHSISYPITSYFGVPHGIAVFLTLPKVVELNYFTTGDTLQSGVRLADIRESFSILFSLFGVDGIEGLRGRLENVLVELGFKTRLRDYGIGREALSFLADNALTKGRSDNNPRQVDRDDVLRLLEEIY
ncbi:MAG: phosphonoacetaldehyde reductase [Candidatus Aminicenantes bacterium]|nr:MAG: phosphonoacetaldehyde reductase [Candidatus Aminicenantes bacterium]